ncbi:hypothetical protein ECG_02156 [Echinococcus granulosus]|uniref:Secreted protein n=1 Tax=Echinococcus granulosus TaxID=6210 RepID=A0A068WW08_ECHGR|nr:hypothetical protein ECG_02156 [Echinococcus granulosus]CDS21805.1 hypothetical protein EgrG_000196300 [Echinococcus granulosus]
MCLQALCLTALFLVKFCHIIAHPVYVSTGEKAVLDFIFSHSSKTSAAVVQWTFLPFLSSIPKGENVENGFHLNTSYHSSRYKNDISQVICPESFIGPPGRTCRLARLSISQVIPADEGIYRARIVGTNTTTADCYPCTGELKLRVLVDENDVGQPMSGDHSDGLMSSEDFMGSNDSSNSVRTGTYILGRL